MRHAGYRTSQIKRLDRDAAFLRATRLGTGSRAAYGAVRHLQSLTHVRARLGRDDSAMARKTVVSPASSHPWFRLEPESMLRRMDRLTMAKLCPDDRQCPDAMDHPHSAGRSLAPREPEIANPVAYKA